MNLYALHWSEIWLALKFNTESPSAQPMSVIDKIVYIFIHYSKRNDDDMKCFCYDYNH